VVGTGAVVEAVAGTDVVAGTGTVAGAGAGTHVVAEIETVAEAVVEPAACPFVVVGCFVVCGSLGLA